ncbi:hypothetical protein QQF64_015753 [Cirrhinus molitorella]|uniref:Uncharacterized protein n=1 Tax=Cirrhinus molitorella TaxID=172907 RepID=A0ABR3NWT9_9TELE
MNAGKQHKRVTVTVGARRFAPRALRSSFTGSGASDSGHGGRESPLSSAAPAEIVETGSARAASGGLNSRHRAHALYVTAESFEIKQTAVTQEEYCKIVYI